jgi:hypothetical protein
VAETRGPIHHAHQPTDDHRKLGRPDSPPVGYGPVRQHADPLRLAREAAGSPSYEAVGKAVNMGKSTMQDTASATKQLPSELNCSAFLRGVELQRLKLRPGSTTPTPPCAGHDQYAIRAARFHPKLDRVVDRPELQSMIWEAITADGVDEAELLARLADAATRPVPDGLPPTLPTKGELLAERCTDDALLWLLFLGGGTPADVRHWKARLDQLPPDPLPEADPAPGGDRRPGPRVSRRAAMFAGGVLAGGALLGVGAAYLTGGDEHRQGQPGRGASATPPPVILPTGGPAAAELDALVAAAGRAAIGTGGFAHVDIVIIIPATSTRVTESLDWSRTAPGRRLVTGSEAPPTPETLPVGPPADVAGPPSADPAELRRMLELRQRPGAATGLLIGVADLCVSYPLDRAERIAVLRMLRDASSLRFTGRQTVEIVGRPGKAFSAETPGGLRETLVFDQADGRLLAHETARLQTDGNALLLRRVVYVRAEWDDLPD